MTHADNPARQMFDHHVEAMQNHAWFYDQLLAIYQRYAIDPAASLCEIGCGSGAWLERLWALGYRRLDAVDFAQNSVSLCQQRVPGATVALHNIEEAPLPERYDLIMLIAVLDFLAEPEVALRHIAASLNDDGLVFISVRNKYAYWPLYHLRGLARFVPGARLRQWFLWFTTPLGMRRSGWPYDRYYGQAELEHMLRAGGLVPVARHGFQALPMLWIATLPRLLRLMQRVERWLQRSPIRAWYYYHVIVCRPDARPERPGPPGVAERA